MYMALKRPHTLSLALILICTESCLTSASCSKEKILLQTYFFDLLIGHLLLPSSFFLLICKPLHLISFSIPIFSKLLNRLPEAANTVAIFREYNSTFLCPLVNRVVGYLIFNQRKVTFSPFYFFPLVSYPPPCLPTIPLNEVLSLSALSISSYLNPIPIFTFSPMCLNHQSQIGRIFISVVQNLHC